MSEETTRTNGGAQIAQIVLAFLGGAATGAAIVALTTPKSGTEARHDLAKMVETGRQSISRVPAAVREASGAAQHAFSQSMSGNGGGTTSEPVSSAAT